MRRLTAVPPLAALLLLLAPLPASAATSTTSGVRCTKVGTAGADTLHGSSYRDVFCGLGGNDVIHAYGGDDLVDGGSGNDTVYGAAGNDTVYGGYGDDVVVGDTGADTVYGGPGNDRAYGGAGNDVLVGHDGADLLSGGAGTDKDYGGPGNDTLHGGDDADVVSGQEGDDDLAGEGGSDVVDGGAGTNWCSIGAGDTQKACVYDRTAPTLGWTSASPNPVDVTSGSRTVTVRLRLLDDTGITSVQTSFQDFETAALGPSLGTPVLVSGTRRDGVWQVTGTARRYSEPGAFELNVDVRDRVGRWTSTSVASAITVRNATPDRTNAVVLGASSSRTSVDVRSANGVLTVYARAVDDASGVEPGDIYACLYSPGSGGAYVQKPCLNMSRYSGTARDGFWRSEHTIPKGSVGGDWNIGVWLNDQVHQGVQNYYVGPDAYRSFTTSWGGTDPAWHELRNGRFSVLGASDNTAATLVGLTTSATSVDTLAAPQTVDIQVRARDATGEGVTEVGGYAQNETGSSDGPGFSPVEGVLTQGTPVDGWWRLRITFPQGTPPGRYPVAQVWVVDKSHWRSYAPPGSTFAGDSGQLPFPVGSVRTSDGAAWDGVITVVQNANG